MKKRIRSVAICGFLFSEAFALAQSPDVSSEKKPVLTKSSSAFRVVASLESGIGAYQDIQLPAGSLRGFRADGRRIGIENVNHVGVPVRGGFQIEYGTYLRNIFADFNLMRMTSLVSPREVSDSQYDRTEANFGGKWGARLFGVSSVSVSAIMGYRKTEFQNISNGHYVESVLPRLGIGLNPNARWNLDLRGGMGIQPRFGYDNGVEAGLLKSSIARLAHVDSSIKYRITSSAAIALGVEYEAADIRLQDTEDYAQLGLTIAPEISNFRNYQLKTTIAMIKLEKRF
jgi:hypothetical protein